VFQLVDDDHRDYRSGHQDLLCACLPIFHQWFSPVMAAAVGCTAMLSVKI
jgi:hypothetical protein